MARGLPSMTALLGLLAIAGYQNRDKIAEMLRGGGGAAPPPGAGRATEPSGGAASDGSLGGLLGGLGSLVGGAGAGGLLSRGLQELVEHFQENGHGDTAQSWVASGPNRDISADQLKQAIGPDVLDTLSKQTGLSHDELLSRLSRELPPAVDRYTPDGRLPAGA
jgi:uncharacterized protein YidB (DUF937 family)